jgi:predicted DNA-binding transcriptional regulator YafY
VGDRVVRIEELRALLASRDVFTAAELAAEMGVSRRTIQRDLATLRDLGVPVEADRGSGGGTWLEQGWSLGRVHLNANEALAILVCLAVAEQIGTPLLPQDQAAVARKINTAFAPRQSLRIGSLRRRVFVGTLATARVQPTYTAPPEQISRTLLACFTSQSVATIDYTDRDGATTRRTIEPQYLYLNQPVWYTLAWDRLRDDVRMFRLDRITAITDTGQHFTLRDRHPFFPDGAPTERTL